MITCFISNPKHPCFIAYMKKEKGGKIKMVGDTKKGRPISIGIEYTIGKYSEYPHQNPQRGTIPCS